MLHISMRRLRSIVSSFRDTRTPTIIPIEWPLSEGHIQHLLLLHPASVSFLPPPPPPPHPGGQDSSSTGSYSYSYCHSSMELSLCHDFDIHGHVTVTRAPSSNLRVPPRGRALPLVREGRLQKPKRSCRHYWYLVLFIVLVNRH
jgi:hypothetical protein